MSKAPVERPRNRCQYPECPERPAKDLCREHSLRWGRIPRRLRDDDLLPNDGLFDWAAVDIAIRGRVPRMTWVEREVVAISLYARGIQPQQIEQRLGFAVSKSRWNKIRNLAGEMQ